MKVLDVSEHNTPYTSIQASAGKVVRLKKLKYHKGFYHMEGVMGYELFHVLKPLQVTNLQVRNPDGEWKTLMVDDPMHWRGMQELTQLTNPGSVLVGGLGLGLILHRLVKRDDITKIKVIEIDPEVINFISPYIPKDKRIEIITDDLLSFCIENKEHFDTAIIDLWVLSETSTKAKRVWVKDCMSITNSLAEVFSDKVLIWGIRGYQVKKKGEVK